MERDQMCFTTAHSDSCEIREVSEADGDLVANHDLPSYLSFGQVIVQMDPLCTDL